MRRATGHIAWARELMRVAYYRAIFVALASGGPVTAQMISGRELAPSSYRRGREGENRWMPRISKDILASAIRRVTAISHAQRESL